MFPFPSLLQADCKIAETSKQGKDMAVAKALWDKTEELISGATTA
jgi:hypothetical protein